MSDEPTDVANQALDAIGYEKAIGDIQEGTRPAQVILRAYGQCLRQLLRGAHWDFARKTAPITLLADATGQTPTVGNLVPLPWYYEYGYPTDCAKVRFIPWNQATAQPSAPPGNIQTPTTPLVTGLGGQPQTGTRLRPARFTVATDPNFSAQPGQSQAAGTSPQGNTVILTNVKNATLVYTAVMLYPSVWDAQFRAGMVAYLASEVALPLWTAKDRAFGLRLRGEQIAIAKAKIQQARITDGNEGWYSSDISVDWMRFRNAGGSGAWNGAGWGDNGPGCTGYGWDSCMFSDGSAY